MSLSSVVIDDTYGVSRINPSISRGPMMQSFYSESLSVIDRWDLPYSPIGPDSCGAFGTFTVTGDVTRYCGADMFSDIGKETGVYAQFTNMFSSEGSPDAERRPKGFDVRFFTRDGDWDLLGSNLPVPVSRIGPHRRDGRRYTAEELWQHCVAKSNLTHMLTVLMSDRGLPASYCHMHGYGSGVHSMVNMEGERFWVRYHLRTNQGILNITDEQARDLVRINPRSHADDLFNEIESGNRPSWTLFMQVMDYEQYHNSEYDPFDSSRVWTHDEYPLIEIGILELDMNSRNGVSAGRPLLESANLVPGMGLSPHSVGGLTPRNPPGMRNDPYHITRGNPVYKVDDYTQAGNLFRMMSESQKGELVDNTVRRISGLDPSVVFRHMVHCYRADADYGGRIADAMDVSVYDVESLSELDEEEFLGITGYT